MQPLQVYSVIPKLPEELSALWELAYNYWFSWKHEVGELFAQIDHEIWQEGEENPVWFLNHIPQDTLEELAKDKFFLERLQEVKESLDSYLSREDCPIDFSDGKDKQPVVAYLSAEFGITRCLPIYSGGLGILAGDHLKSASDLNIPLVAIGLCYQQGYFRQYLTQDGWQQERYPVNDFTQMPLTLMRQDDNTPLSISVTLEGRELKAQIWQARVGRIKLYLLDTNIPDNPPDFREITSQLYGGGLDMRIRQEILLGIGGIRALSVLGLNPKVIHMNEGHSAFAGLERIKVFIHEKGLSLEAAMELVASSSVFTTHTPVPAGNDRFPPDMMQRYFMDYARELGLAFKVFLALGRENPRDDHEEFCMTVLALRLSRFNNGVSLLHGQVSRSMWKNVWPQYPEEDVPIEAITNGVHIPTWLSQDLAYLFDRYLGPTWREDADCERVWRNAEAIPDTELWRTHERLRGKLVDFVRERLKKQIAARGGRRGEMQDADEVLDPQALTIGFARRFATYKRAYLLLKDKDRLKKLVSNKDYPVQFVFAGKAHPRDQEGKKIIQQLVQLCKQPEYRHCMVFLEDYDIEVAQHMVQGCDVWLNNPRRPLEACGTSGMKAMANGVLNVSTLDGWWDEAYAADTSLGWAIGQREEYTDDEYQDFVESQTMYNVLERDVVPAYYERQHSSIPRSWVRRMKNELRYLAPEFHSHRMVADYAKKTYLPAYLNFSRLAVENFEPAKGLASWRMNLMTKWSAIKIRAVQANTQAGKSEIYVGHPVEISAEVYTDGLSTTDIQVEIYAGKLGHEGCFLARETALMHSAGVTVDGWNKYTGIIKPEFTGKFGYTVRILPHHELLLDPHCLGLIHWAN